MFMTVINAMKFNKDQGALISDAQRSYGNRKDDTAKKIATIYDKKDTLVVVGGAGLAFINNETVDFVQSNFNDPQSFEMVLDNFAKSFNNVTLKNIFSEMYKRYGSLSEQEVLTGRLNGGGEITERVKENYFRDLMDIKNNLGQNVFLVLGKDANKKMDLYMVEGLSQTPVLFPSVYASIGSGSDISSLELSKFINDLTREGRENINPIEGLVSMLYATYLSGKNNYGVGGIPEIAFIDKDEIVKPSEYSCQLANEIATAGKRGLLREDYVFDAIDSLILKNQSFEDVEPSMWNEAKNNGKYDKLNLFLRGYKI